MRPGAQAIKPQAEGATLLAFPGILSSARGALAAAFKFHRLPERLADSLLRRAAANDPVAALTQALATRMHAAPLDLNTARSLLLIGPAQAGKSAVAAKILHEAARMGRHAEHMRAADAIAARRSRTAPTGTLCVMETAGFNPVNPRAATAFAALSQIDGVDSIGIVSALSDAEDAGEMVTGLRFRHVIVTGLDRTRRLGALLAAATRGAGLAHVTFGPEPMDALVSLSPRDLAQRLLTGFI